MGEKKDLIELLKWATSNDTGVSSKALCRYMIGIRDNLFIFDYPRDVGDRGRCIRMLNKNPKWWDRLDELDETANWNEQVMRMRNER